MTKRSGLEINALILKTIRDSNYGNSLVFRVMCKCGLRYATVTPHINELEKLGMISYGTVSDSEERPDRAGAQHELFSITTRGALWLQKFEALYDEMYPLEMEVLVKA